MGWLVMTVWFAVAGGVCPEREIAIVVDTGAHELVLCEAGRAAATFSVAIGRGGTGKRVEGDNKTPLGDYALGEPRASEKFDVFVPVEYPTKKQAQEGYTGGAIGIHGPSRGGKMLGRFNGWVDWTRGCIAVASDDEIERLADWVRRNKPALVHVR
jgi:murein L,D-transpeptidase YafK